MEDKLDIQAISQRTVSAIEKALELCELTSDEINRLSTDTLKILLLDLHTTVLNVVNEMRNKYSKKSG